MKYIKYTFLLSLLLAGIMTSAQEVADSLNLIENGSFEEFEGKLKKPGQIEFASPWKSPTETVGDLFSENITYDAIRVPQNYRGHQSALSGVNYAGFMAYSYQNKEPRSYLMAKFKQPLKKGQKYCVRYYVSLSDLSKYAVNQVTAYVSKQMINKSAEGNLTYKAQVPAMTTRIYDDPYAWKGVCGTIDGTGLENYLILGNFMENDRIDFTKVRRPKGESRPQSFDAYYFVDDVAVFPVRSASQCKCDDMAEGESDYIFGKKVTTNKALPADQRMDRAAIYFKRFRSEVDNSMEPLMQELVEVMMTTPAIRIKLIGHNEVVEHERVKIRPDLTDLDKERAIAVKEYFVENGIDASRIETTGVGHEHPSGGGDDEVSLAKNRRVEIDLLP